MKVTERIEVRKIYLGSATLFGLVYGLVIGIIFAIIVLILGFSNIIAITGIFTASFNSGAGLLDNLTSDIFTFSGVSLLVIAIGGLILGFIGALVYNLVAMIGGKLHLGLAEYERGIKVVNVAAKKTPSIKIAATPVKNVQLAKTTVLKSSRIP